MLFYRTGRCHTTAPSHTSAEEAAAQGLVAGVNAALKVKNQGEFILSRSNSYIGVMIDDLITKGVSEPYRMFTSRAEHRLVLREDNVYRRLSGQGRRIGLLSQERYDAMVDFEAQVDQEIQRIEKTMCKPNAQRHALLAEKKSQPIKIRR